MPKAPKVIDVEGVNRGAQLRRVLLLLLFAAALVGLYLFYTRSQPPVKEPAEATGVRSTVTASGDSLQVAVDWALAIDSSRAVPESVRVEVGLSGGQAATVSTRGSDEHTDTLRVTAPAPGQTASGYSCVAPVHRGQLRRESCTPWQFVRPAADTTASDSTAAGRDSAAPARRRTGAATSPKVTRIVVQPGGLQVDPDVDGRCARWQRDNPGRSVWVDVNRRAVPECTGVNGKPVVAQFCAFAELSNGQRVKTENSARDRYCDRLFQEWSGERVS